MPVHDWTRVSAGTFHAFHLAWIAELQKALNAGLLPTDYYALAEQVAGRTIPDVLTLQDLSGPLADEGFVSETPGRGTDGSKEGGIAVADAPPAAPVIAHLAEATLLALKRRRLVIRHTTGDRIVALIEVISPGNKTGEGPMQAVVDKAVAALQQGYHLQILDLLPPGPADPNGIHDRIWREVEGGSYRPPQNQPLTLAAYRCSDGVTAYVQPIGVGGTLPALPLFLSTDRYIDTPLGPTYDAAFDGMPAKWQAVLRGTVSQRHV